MFRATFSVGGGDRSRHAAEPSRAREADAESLVNRESARFVVPCRRKISHIRPALRDIYRIFLTQGGHSSLSHVPNATCARGLTGHTWKTRKCFMVRSFACHAVMYYQTRVRPAWSAKTGTETQSLPTARSRYRTTIPERIGGRTLFPCPRA